MKYLGKVILCLSSLPFASASAAPVAPEFQSKHYAIALSRTAPAFSLFSVDSLGQGRLDENPVRLETNPVAINEMPGDAAAAREAYRRMGQVVGDALGDALTLLDGLVVIGGGISKSWRLFLPAAMQELNEVFIAPNGNESRRLRPAIYCLEDPAQLKCFLNVASREIIVPRSERKIRYDATPRLAVGITRLGTSEAIALGAYAFALRALEKR